MNTMIQFKVLQTLNMIFSEYLGDWVIVDNKKYIHEIFIGKSLLYIDQMFHCHGFRYEVISYEYMFYFILE